jgi:hypothetical protein
MGVDIRGGGGQEVQMHCSRVAIEPGTHALDQFWSQISAMPGQARTVDEHQSEGACAKKAPRTLMQSNATTRDAWTG